MVWTWLRMRAMRSKNSTKARKAANRKVKSEAPSGDEGTSTPLRCGGVNDGLAS